MKRRLLSILIICAIAMSSCDSGDDSFIPQGELVLSVAAAEVSPYVTKTDGDIPTTSESIFEAGDMITVVGASDEDVVFVLSDDGEWLSLSQFSWMDTPQTVYAYYGTSTSISDGDQMPDLLMAEIDCGGTIPPDGILSFTEDGAFCHATALVEVKISGWAEYANPTVTLGDIHSVISLSNTGYYITNSKILYSITLELISSSDGVLVYQARVPAGNNIAEDYTLMVNTINVFEYLLDDSLTPSTFEAGEKFTFSLDYEYDL